MNESGSIKSSLCPVNEQHRRLSNVVLSYRCVLRVNTVKLHGKMLLFLCLLAISKVSVIADNTAVLILARGGSKGVPLKNIQTVGGRSLLWRAIHTAKIAGLHDITVSTDHPLIALEAIRSGANILARSPITATDWAPSIWGAQEFISKRSDVEKLILIQATSPFLTKQTLLSAVKKVDAQIPVDCIFSVMRTFKLCWSLKCDQAAPVNFYLDSRPRRQDWAGELFETGALYIARRHLIENGYFQNKK